MSLEQISLNSVGNIDTDRRIFIFLTLNVRDSIASTWTTESNVIISSCGNSPVVVQNVTSDPSITVSGAWFGSQDVVCDTCAPVASSATFFIVHLPTKQTLIQNHMKSTNQNQNQTASQDAQQGGTTATGAMPTTAGELTHAPPPPVMAPPEPAVLPGLPMTVPVHVGPPPGFTVSMVPVQMPVGVAGVPGPPGVIHTCTHCGYTSAKKASLTAHMKIHTEDKPFVCNNCGFRARLKTGLVAHQRIHTGEKPFACNQCDYRANQRGHLTRHLKVHTDEKPFACNQCGFRARLKTGLTAHLRIHSGEKPFACELCDYRANQTGHLGRHRRTVHGKTTPDLNVLPTPGAL
eukprot:m.375180 g.375180  ORF g.375180 m.375180 type:complete len:348 (+) comp16698_c0_seq5:3969-5012(+)